MFEIAHNIVDFMDGWRLVVKGCSFIAVDDNHAFRFHKYNGLIRVCYSIHPNKGKRKNVFCAPSITLNPYRESPKEMAEKIERVLLPKIYNMEV